MVPHSLLTAMRIQPRSKVIPSRSHASKASSKPLFAPEMKKVAICCSFSATPKVAVFYQLDDLGKCEQRRRSTPRPFDKLQQIGVCCIEPRRYRNPGGLLDGARTAFATSRPADVATKTVCWTLFALCLPHQDPRMLRPRRFIGRCSRCVYRIKTRGCRDLALRQARGCRDPASMPASGPART